MKAPEPLRRGAPAAAILVCFGGLLAWSWGRWMDPQIDFGNELYIAWRLAEGDALYRDIAHRHGPLSHYVNALWFLLFGVSIRTLVCFNAAILLGVCALLYAILRDACGRTLATFLCCLFLVLFAFSQYLPIGNFNFITPYHHFQTHGLALSLAMIILLSKGSASGRLHFPILAGICLGLVFLTKIELFLPAAATVAAALLAIRQQSPAARPRFALALGGAAVVSVLVAWGLLSLAMPAGTALEGVLGNWRHVGGGLADDPFYRSVTGLDQPLANLGAMLKMAATFALFALGLLALDRGLPALRESAAASWASGAALLGLLLWLQDWVAWRDLPRALPLVALAVCAWLWRPAAVRADPTAGSRVRLFSVYGLALLAKVILHVRIEHYGFSLAMPATLLLGVALVSLLPAALEARYGGGTLARALAVGALLAGALVFWQSANEVYAHKTLSLGTGADRIFVTDRPGAPRGLRIAHLVERIEAQLQPGEHLLVMPEGAGIHYWLREVMPTRMILFLPTELQAFGGDAGVLEDLRAAPPDVVVLAHRGHREFGVGPFGRAQDNGLAIGEWLRAHYRRVELIGPEPFSGRGFGASILRRKVDRKDPGSEMP